MHDKYRWSGWQALQTVARHTLLFRRKKLGHGVETFCDTASRSAGLIRHAVEPYGPSAILIHGSPGTALEWNRLMAELPRNWNILAPYRKGYGAFARDGGETCLAGHAAALIPCMDAEGEGTSQKKVVLGHSYGAPVAARLAADYPERCSGLILMAGSLDPYLEEVFAIQRWAAHPMAQALLPRALRHANKELMALRGELDALAARLERISCPVHIIHAEDDSLVPYANTAYIRHKCSHVPVHMHILKDGGHMLQITRRPELIKILAGIFASISTGQAAQ